MHYRGTWWCNLYVCTCQFSWQFNKTENCFQLKIRYSVLLWTARRAFCSSSCVYAAFVSVLITSNAACDNKPLARKFAFSCNPESCFMWQAHQTVHKRPKKWNQMLSTTQKRMASWASLTFFGAVTVCLHTHVSVHHIFPCLSSAALRSHLPSGLHTMTWMSRRWPSKTLTDTVSSELQIHRCK